MPVPDNVTQAIDLAIPANTASADTIHTLIANYKDGIALAATVEHSVSVIAEPFLLQHRPGQCGVCAIGTTSELENDYDIITVDTVSRGKPPYGAVGFDTDSQCPVIYNNTAWVPSVQRLAHVSEVTSAISISSTTYTDVHTGIEIDPCSIGDIIKIEVVFHLSPGASYDDKHFKVQLYDVDAAAQVGNTYYAANVSNSNTLFWYVTASAVSHEYKIQCARHGSTTLTRRWDYSQVLATVYPQVVAGT